MNATLTVNSAGTARYDFTYPDRAGFIAAGWNFIAKTPSGVMRNTERTTGAVVSYDQAAHPGTLRIPVDSGDMWGSQNNTRNSLFRSLSSNWTSIKLKLSFAPTQNYQQAGLLAYQDDDNYVQVTRIYGGGNKVTFAREINGNPSALNSATETATANLILRLDRDPSTQIISAYYSKDGSSWTAMGSVTQALNNPQLAVFVGASPGGFPNADLSWAEVITENPVPSTVLLSTDALSFTTAQGTDPLDRTIALSNSGGGAMNWTAVANAPFVVSPASGTGNATLTVSVNSAGLVAGTYTGAITIAAEGATNSPQTVNATLTVNPVTFTPSGHYDFTCADRESLLAAGWSFLAVPPSGGTRNTEQATGAVVSYDQTAHPGILRIPVDVGDLWAGQNNTRNTLLRNLPPDWTSIRLKLSFAPTQNYQQAGLLAYQDDDNYVQVTRIYGGGNAVTFARELNGYPVVLNSVTETATDLYLRLDRYPATQTMSAYYSKDGSSWAAMGSITQALANPRLAIFAGASPGGLPNADLSWAEVHTGTQLQTIEVNPAVLNFSSSEGTAPAGQTLELSTLSASPSTFMDYALSSPSWALFNASYDQGTLLLRENTSIALHHAYLSSSYPLGKAAFTVEVKPAGRNWVKIGYNGYMYFDIQDGAAGASSNIAAYGIRPLSDGWYEISVASASDTNSNADLVIAAVDNGGPYQGNGTSGVLVRNPRFVSFREGKSAAHTLSSSPVKITDPYYKYRGGVTIGDSFTADANYTKHANAVSTHLLVVNKGIGGQTLSQIVGRFDTDVASYSPSFVLLMGGINDINNSTSDPLSSMQSQVQFFVSKCNSINAVPVLTTLPPDKNYPGYWTPERQAWMDTYNAWISSYASSKGYALIDLKNLLSTDGITLKAAYDSGDHLHPNTAGYNAIGNEIVALLDNVPLTTTFNWTATADADATAWLSVSPTSGTGDAVITVSVNNTGLTPGTYTKAITISAPGAANTPQTVNVTLTVNSSGTGPLHYDFTYPDKAGLTAGGWDFLAVTPSGGIRNTEQTTGTAVSYDQTAHPGILRIPVDSGDMWENQNNTRNTLLRNLPSNWTSIRLKLSFRPTQNYQQAGLLAYQDDDNYVNVTRIHGGNDAVTFAKEINGYPNVVNSAMETVTDLILRLDRAPATDSISAYYSKDGSSWIAMGSVTQALNNPKLAIFAGASPGGFPNADLSWVEVDAGP